MKHLFWSSICKTPGCEELVRSKYIGETEKNLAKFELPPNLSEARFEYHCHSCGKTHTYIGHELKPRSWDKPPEPEFQPWF